MECSNAKSSGCIERSNWDTRMESGLISVSRADRAGRPRLNSSGNSKFGMMVRGARKNRGRVDEVNIRVIINYRIGDSSE